eukprot:4812476-Heterocapsa_arctica.AAC.1
MKETTQQRACRMSRFIHTARTMEVDCHNEILFWIRKDPPSITLLTLSSLVTTIALWLFYIFQINDRSRCQDKGF